MQTGGQNCKNTNYTSIAAGRKMTSMSIKLLITFISNDAFSDLTLLVRCQEEHPACKN